MIFVSPLSILFIEFLLVFARFFGSLRISGLLCSLGFLRIFGFLCFFEGATFGCAGFGLGRTFDGEVKVEAQASEYYQHTFVGIVVSKAFPFEKIAVDMGHQILHPLSPIA